jgi:hypothetical protein
MALAQAAELEIQSAAATEGRDLAVAEAAKLQVALVEAEVRAEQLAAELERLRAKANARGASGRAGAAGSSQPSESAFCKCLRFS